jgi:hypothetical protein
MLHERDERLRQLDALIASREAAMLGPMANPTGAIGALPLTPPALSASAATLFAVPVTVAAACSDDA